eukprot:CAMPEP_0117495390 /NCGR_PEP_ID=MMETSP0784-20121206/20106_1 /TAXON_ID=39447 /ORGANISM="" /LENGTH=430 /DNA_ID=CAMNT_0005290307 /DNA_START=121 /DNA_END=1413 /DNA_ORIENTATION=-
MSKEDILQFTRPGNKEEFENCSKEYRSDREFVLQIVKKGYNMLQYAADELRDDKAFALQCVAITGGELEGVSARLKNDRDVVLAAVSKQGNSFQFASPELRGDPEVFLAAINENENSSESIIRFASEEIRHDPEMVIAAVARDGRALRFVPEEMLENKEVAIAAMQSKYGAQMIKILRGGLNQDPDVLQAAGLLIVHRDLEGLENAPLIVLSVKFSLSAGATAGATNLYRVLTLPEGTASPYFPTMKAERPYSADHRIYFPNIYNKGFCKFDANGEIDWSTVTEKSNACYGKCGVSCYILAAGCGDEAMERCRHAGHQASRGQNLDHGCWQYSFRQKLEEAKRSRGCMLQLVEAPEGKKPELGGGQQIEAAMAKEVGVRIFTVIYDYSNGASAYSMRLPHGKLLLNPGAGIDNYLEEAERLRDQIGKGPW